MGGSHKMYTVAQKLAMLPAAAMRTKHLAPSGQWAWRAPKFSKRQVTTLVPPPARGGPPRARACCTAGDRARRLSTAPLEGQQHSLFPFLLTLSGAAPHQGKQRGRWLLLMLLLLLLLRTCTLAHAHAHT